MESFLLHRLRSPSPSIPRLLVPYHGPETPPLSSKHVSALRKSCRHVGRTSEAAMPTVATLRCQRAPAALAPGQAMTVRAARDRPAIGSCEISLILHSRALVPPKRARWRHRCLCFESSLFCIAVAADNGIFRSILIDSASTLPKCSIKQNLPQYATSVQNFRANKPAI